MALAALASCGSGDRSPDPPGESPREPVEPPPTLEFLGSQTLVLNPGATHTVELEITPGGSYPIYFALLSEPGVAHGGVLDRTQTRTNAQGRASVSITAPNLPARFTLRASTILSVSDSLPISVTAAGFGALGVRPSYAGGRAVAEWVAGVHFGKRCEDLALAPPQDGDLIGRGSKDIAISNVPVSLPFALTVRAGHYLNGCITSDALNEGETRPLFVPIGAVPLKLEETVLDVAIGLEPGDRTLSLALERALEDALGALRQSDLEAPPAPDDVAALLEAMQLGLSPMQAESFALARAQENWDESVAFAMGDPDRTRLSETLTRWVTIGQAALLSPRAFEGKLEASLAPGQAQLTMIRMAGIPAGDVGLFAEQPSSWEADASDKLAFGGTLAWTPSRLLALIAAAPALAEVGGTSVPDALNRLYPCQTVGETLATPGTSFASCDATCLEPLCQSAMNALWDRVRNFSGTGLERLALTAAGSATVGSEAQAVGLEGSWVGRLASTDSAATGGPLRGFAPRGD